MIHQHCEHIKAILRLSVLNMDSIFQHLQTALTPDAQEELLFLCLDLGSVLPNQSLLKNLQTLAEQNQITFLHLAEALYHIERLDIIGNVLHIQPSVIKECLAKKSLFSAYRISLLQANYKLIQQDVIELIFLTRNLLNKVHADLTFLQIVGELERLQLIGPQNIEFLATCLDHIGRLDVAHFLRHL